MRFTITQKLSITISLFIIAGAAIIFYLIIPAFSSIREATNAIVSQISSEEQELERLRLLRRSLTHIDTIESDLSDIAHISVSKAEEDTLIQHIEEIASTYSIEQSLSVSFNPDTTSPDFSGYYLFSVAAKGTYENIRAYLHHLESIPYYLVIPKITIEKTTGSIPGTPMILIRFNAVLNQHPS
jgi:hypothetical protein